MASRNDSPGKRVKTFSASVQQPDLTTENVVVVVYFKAGDGEFLIPLPEHVAKALDERDGRVRAKTLDEVMEAWHAAVARYKRILQDEKRERVIKVTYQRNSRRHRSRDSYRQEISFALSPAIVLHFEVLWRVGKSLYRQHRPDDPLQHVGTASDGLIPWTPEREAFLADMVDRFETLIGKMDEFFASADGLDRAIAQGAALQLIAPPRASGEEG